MVLGDDPKGTPWGAWAGVVMLAMLAVAAWRSSLELHPATVYRRGVFGWRPPIGAADVEEVTLEWEILGLPHRELTLHLYDKRAFAFPLRWWSRWWRLVGWLATSCTREEDGHLVWAVRTDARTRDRLERYAQPLDPGSATRP